MLNLRFNLRDGKTHMEYDVHPRSQDEPIIVPDGAVSVVLYLGVGPTHAVTPCPAS